MKIFIKKHLWFASFAFMALCSLHVVGMGEHKEPASVKHKKTHPIKIIIETPEQLMQIIVNLLDDKYNTSDIASRILDTASILYNNKQLLLLRDQHNNTAFEILHEAFDRFYDIQHRKNHSEIKPKNNYLGLSWVLELATTRQLTLQSLYDFISIDTKNPEKMIHIIQYFLDHGTSQDELKQFFLEHDIDIEDSSREDSDGVTALMLAAYNGFENICSFLMKTEILVKTTDKIGNDNALHYAVEKGHTPIVELLCDCGAEDAPNSSGLRPSTRALQLANERPIENTKAILQALLAHTIIDDSRETIWEEKYFYLYAHGLTLFSPQLVAKILGYIDTWCDPTTMLTYAASHNYHPIIKFLKKADIDPNALDQYGTSPLYYAASCGNASAVELLTHMGAQDIPIKNGLLPSTLVQAKVTDIRLENSLRIMWALLSANSHPQQQATALISQLYCDVVNIIKNHVTPGTAALILAYINPLLNIDFIPRLGAYSRFYIKEYEQNPYQIYAAIKLLSKPEDQSITILDIIGRWLRATAAPIIKFDSTDTDGTTPFDIAIKNESWQAARVLASADSRPNSIKALHTLLDHLRYHNKGDRIAQMRILKTIAILSGISVNNIDTAHYHNDFIIPLANRFRPLIDNNHHQSTAELENHTDQLDHDLATAVEVHKAIPELQTFATPLLAIIMSYLMHPPTHTHCS